MKKIKLSVIMLILSAAACGLGGCREDALQAYNAGDNVCFWIHSQNYSFYGAPANEMPEGIVELDLNIMGFTAPYDREVTGVAVEDEPGTPEKDKVTTARPEHYRILGGTVPAGSTTGKFRVAVLNVDEFADSELRLTVGLTENEHFGLGLRENQHVTIRWSRQLLQPQTWNSMRTFICSTYSTQVYRLFMEATGRKEMWYSSEGPDPANNPEDRKVSVEEAHALGRAFGDLVRKLQATDDPRGYHDDGALAGQKIVPRY